MIVNLRVLLFAAARDIARRDAVAVSLSTSPTVAELRLQLARQHPELANIASRSAIAVNHEFVEDSDTIRENDEIALIPPVSGG